VKGVDSPVHTSSDHCEGAQLHTTQAENK